MNRSAKFKKKLGTLLNSNEHNIIKKKFKKKIIIIIYSKTIKCINIQFFQVMSSVT